MNFRRGLQKSEPEINLIPLIDVLLVILIFLMVTTTYNRFTALKISLPVADATKAVQLPSQIVVSVAADGTCAVDKRTLPAGDPATLRDALRQAVSARGQAGEPPVVVISADAKASHQSVINVMEAARESGLARLTFATRAPRRAAQ